MSDTTIRLDSAVRDKLRALATDHVTLGDLLSRLAEREQYQREMRRANEVMDRMRGEDPAAWQEYLSELGAFEAGAARDGLTAPRPTGLNTTTPEARQVPYQAGDVLLADLDPVAGHEQGGRRPVLVLSGPSYNELRNEQSSWPRSPAARRCLPYPRRRRLRAAHAELGSVRMVRAISAQRVIGHLGRARPETVAEVRNRVINFLRDW